MHTIFNHSFNSIVELRHVISILIACACGWAIGYERKARNKQAGVKTHIIVALTSVLMMILSKEAFLDTPSYDTSRVAAQIVSGISFIGGGIIFTRDKKISGITTAAGIWATAAGIWATAGIGMAIGANFWIFGIFCSLIVVLVQLVTHSNIRNHVIYQVKILIETNDITLPGRIYSKLGVFDFRKSNVELKEQLDNGSYDILISIENDKEISVVDVEDFLFEYDKNLKIKEFKLKNYVK